MKIKLFTFISLLISLYLSNWNIINYPDNFGIAEITADNSGVYVSSFSGFYHSTNDSQNWDVLPSNNNIITYYGLNLFEKVDDYLFVSQFISQEEFYNYRIYYDGNDWNGWELIPYQSSVLMDLVYNNNIMYSILDGNIAYSSDFGLNWTFLLSPPIDSYINLLLLDNDYLYVNHGCDIYRTNNMGEDWEYVTGEIINIGPPPPYGCTDIMDIINFKDKLVVSVYWYGGVGTLLQSDNEEINWIFIDNFPSTHQSGYYYNNVSRMVSKYDVLYLGTATSSDGLYYTEDVLNFYDYSQGLSSYDLSISTLVSSNNFLYKRGGTINVFQAELIIPDYPEGDFNQDGLVNIQDVIIIINYILDSSFDEDFDLNNDGVIDVLDVISLISIIL